MCGLALADEVFLFRGLRLKVGIDVGHVHANINPNTGRMAYRCVCGGLLAHALRWSATCASRGLTARTLVARRGRVMNRAARIADKAGSGHVWCSRAAFDAMDSAAGVSVQVRALRSRQATRHPSVRGRRGLGPCASRRASVNAKACVPGVLHALGPQDLGALTLKGISDPVPCVRCLLAPSDESAMEEQQHDVRGGAQLRGRLPPLPPPPEGPRNRRSAALAAAAAVIPAG